MIRVYVAGPYSSDPEAGVSAAVAAASRLIDWGYAPFIPHLSHFIEKSFPKSYRVWMNIDAEFQKECDVLLRLPGESPGADCEVDLARRIGQRVVYSLEELKPC